MEIIEIMGGKIVFLLNPTDTKKYCLTGSHSSMREGYCRLITDTGCDRSFLSDVTVQIFDSKNGGCEMFVTKIQDGSVSDRMDFKKEVSYIYAFNSLDNMLMALSSLFDMGTSNVSAYRDEVGDRYFLSLGSECKHLSEFMAKRSKHLLPEYLSEHCSLICHNAVDTLSQFI